MENQFIACTFKVNLLKYQIMLPKKRKPTHPGEILWEEFLIPMGLSQIELAERMGVSVQRINTLINGKRACTPKCIE